MKNLFVAAALMLSAAALHAEGYQVNSLSARQNGMGHTGVALKLGAESMFFNPAGVVFSNNTLDLTGSFTAISSHVNAWLEDDKYSTNNKVSTPLNFGASFRIYDNLYAGLSFYTPYGSSINWGKNWPGAVLNQSVDLKVYTVQPTFSWRIIPNLSIGAGVMVSWGSVNLNKALVSASSFDALLDVLNVVNQFTGNPVQYQPYGQVAPASVNLTGNSAVAVGVNVGAMYDINRQWTVGASFRSKMNMHVKAGDVIVEYANDQAQAILQEELNNLNSTNFDASMPCPYVLSAGVSYKPIEKLVVAADFQLNGWSAYKTLDMSFANQEKFNQHLKKDYKNAMTYHLGAQYTLTERFDVRAGLMVDTSPCNTEYYNPETPGTTRVEPSVGLSFRPVKGLSIDLGFLYVTGSKVNGATGRYDDFIAPKYNAAIATINPMLTASGQPNFPELPVTGTIKGDYKLHAFISSIGLSYSF